MKDLPLRERLIRAGILLPAPRQPEPERVVPWGMRFNAGAYLRRMAASSTECGA